MSIRKASGNMRSHERWSRIAAFGSTAPIPLLAGLIMAVLVLVSTARYGIGMTPDAVYYVAAARSFARSGRILGINGLPMTHYAPLLSVVLGTVGLATRLDPRTVAPFVQAAIAGAAVWLVCSFVRAHVRDRRVAVWACAMAAGCHPLLRLAGSALSEPLFALTLVAASLALHRFLATRRYAWCVAAALAVAAAGLTRYVGVALIPVAAACLLLDGRAAFRRRMANAIGFSAIALLPVAAWYARNYALSGTLTGDWERGHRPLSALAAETVSATLNLLMPGTVPVSATAGAAVMTVAAAALAGLLLRDATGWTPRRLWETDRAWYVPGAFACGYVAMLWLAMRSVSVSGIDVRYLSPAVLPALMALAVAMDTTVSRVAGRAAAAALSVLLGATALLFMGRSFAVARNAFLSGAGVYEQPSVRRSRLAMRARACDPRAVLFSTDPYMINVLTGRLVEGCLPRDQGADVRRTPVRSAREFAAYMSQRRPAYLVQFDDHHCLTGYEAEQLSPYVTLREVFACREGRLFEVGGMRTGEHGEPAEGPPPAASGTMR